MRSDGHARSLTAFLPVVLLLMLPASTATGQATAPATAPAQTQPDVPVLPNRLIAWFNIGGSSPDPERYFIGRISPNRGWPQFVDREITPLLRLGIRRIIIHNPFGLPAEPPMQFDMALHVQRDGARWVTAGFVEAWLPVTRGELTDGEPVEVICYLGKLHDDSSFAPTNPLIDPRNYWLNRAYGSIQLPLAAGMSIGFDSGSDWPADSREFAFLELLEALGVRTYIEPRPYRHRPHLFTKNIISTNHHWIRADPEGQGHPDRLAKNGQLTGEIIRLVLPSPQTAGDARWHITRILADGHTAAVLLPPLLKENSLRDLLPRAVGE